MDPGPQRRLLEANPGQLYLPPNQDPMYGYQSVNVEARGEHHVSVELDPDMLAVRRRHGAFADGTFPGAGRVESVGADTS